MAAANVDGGKIRQIAVNLNRDLLYAKGISVLDVVRSVNDSNFLMPSGDIKIGTIDYNMFTNNQFQLVKPMEDIIVRKVGDVPVQVRDLGWRPGLVRAADERGPRRRTAGGLPPREQAAVGQHHRGRRRGQERSCPGWSGCRPGSTIGLIFDQSTYIRQSIESLWHESIQGRRSRSWSSSSSFAASSRRSSSPSRFPCRSCARSSPCTSWARR